MKAFFSDIGANFLRVFWGKNFLWHLLAMVATFGIVATGLDWWYFLHTRDHVLQLFLLPALVVGGLLPIVLPLALWAIGSKKKNLRIKMAAFTLGQAAMLGSFISSLYKAFTGRIQPDLTNVLVDSSHHFQFGFWRNGIFWGWPSSHTTIAFAMAVSLVYLFPANKRLRFFAMVYALYIGLAVSTNIHWFSEFVAGAVIGSLIGKAVGTSFRKRLIQQQ